MGARSRQRSPRRSWGVAKPSAIARWSSRRRFTAKRSVAPSISHALLSRVALTSTMGGLSDTISTAVAVNPSGAPPRRVVTTVTEAGQRRAS
jgi:hypothetical protein